MGQYDILQFLKAQQDRWFTSKDIRLESGLGNQSSVTMNLKKLRKQQLVEFKQEQIGRAGLKSYLYKYKEEGYNVTTGCL